MVESTAKLREEILALSGVDIMENANEFKSTYAIMDELAAKWEDLTDIQQASVTELIAGKRQGNIVSSLMTNFDTARDALETSLNSSGSAMREHEKWQQSLEAQINKLKASWQGLSQAFLKSDFLKGALNGIIGLVDGLTKLIDTFGTLPTLLGTVATGMSLFKNKGLFTFDKDTKSIQLLGTQLIGLKGKYTQIQTAISRYNSLSSQSASFQEKYNKAMANSNTSMGKYLSGLNGAKASFTGYIGSLVGATVKTIALEVATVALNAAITMGVSLIIQGIVTAITKWINADKELAEEVDELTSKFKEQHEELRKLKNDYDTTNESSMISKYEKLSKGVDSLGRNVSLTADEYSEYQSIVNSIAEQIPSLILGYDEQGNALLACKGNVEALTEAYEKLIHAQNNEVLTKAGDIEEDFENVVDNANNSDFFNNEITSKDLELLETMLEGKYTKEEVTKYLNDNIPEGDGGIRTHIRDALENAGIDVGFGAEGIDEAIAETIKTNPQKIKSVIDSFYADLEKETDGMKSIAQAKLSEAFDISSAISGLNYGNIGEDLQALAYQTVNSLDYEFFANLQEKGKTVEDWVSEMLTQLNSISEDNNAQIEAAFDLQTKFNGGEISYGEYVQGLKDVETTIDELNLKKTAKNQLKISLGLDDNGVVGQYEALLNRLTETSKKKISTGNVIGLGLEEAKEFLDNLSSDELSLVNNVIKDFKPISTDKIKEEFDKFEEGGNVDLTLRPEVDTSVLKDAGWKDAGEGAATVFTSTFSNAAGDVAMNFTPIITDKDGKHIGTLSPKELQEYAENVINGAEDVKGLKIGATFEGDDAIAQAESAAQRIHQLQDYYYNGTSAQLQSAIDRMMAIQGLTFDLNLEVETAGVESLNTALAESVSATGLSSESIDALKGRYADLESEGYNLSAMFEETSNGIHLNKNALSELEQAYAKQKKTDIDEQLGKLQKEYELVTQDIENCTDAQERASLYVQRDAIIQQINDAATLASQYKGLASAYNAWLAAEDAGSERDMYENIIEGFETVSDEISRGWIDDGTIKFLELLTGRTDLASKSGKELKEIYDDLDNAIKHTGYSISDFFTVDDDGNSTNTGVYNFLDAIGQLKEEVFSGKDVVKRDNNGNIIGFDFELVGGDEAIAEALGISEELVQIMVRAADDAGFVVNLEGAYAQLADLKTEAETARDVLISLKKDGLDNLKDTDVNFDFNAEGNDLVAEQEKAIKLLDKFKKDGKIDLTMEGAQEALDIAEYLTIRLDDLTEPKYMQIDTSTVEEDLQEPIEKMQEFERLSKEKHLLTLTGDTEGIENVKSKMDEIAQYLDSIEDEETQVKLGIKGLSKEEIAEKLEKGEIELNAELNVDVQMSDDLKDMRLMMMNQLGLVSDAEVKLKIGYDIDDSVVEELTEEEKEVVVKYIADHEEVEDWSPEAKNAFVKYLVDGGDPEKFDPDDKDSWVVYDTDTSKPDGYDPNDPTATVTYEKDTSDVDSYDPPNFWRTIYYKAQEIFSNITSGGKKKAAQRTGADLDGSGANGTANVNGTTGRAFKQGSWGTKNSGTALVGELGREVLVRDGRYYTIGNNGAEFIKYKKGDIIFNHVQSEELFKNGKVTAGGGRAKALVGGTAFASGTAFSSGSGGGIRIESDSVVVNTKSSDSSKNSKSSSSSKSNGSSGSGGGSKVSGTSAKSKADSKSSSSSSSSEKEFEETIDWVETALSRIEREIDNLDKKANNVYKSWSERNSALSKEINKVGDEIALQQSAYNRYIQEANSVGLSSSWISKVQNGAIDINTITDESLKEKIDEYQKWYEKALACQDAIEELREQESKLYAQRFENVQAQYDGILQGYEHTESMLNEYINQAEAKGHIISKKYYEALISNEKQNIAQLKNEQASLIAERDKAVADGKIARYSQEWYDMCQEIDGVTEAIEAANTKVIEFGKSIRELDWEKFDFEQELISDVAAESDFYIDLMSKKDLHDDQGNLTAQGAATLGLHGLNHNTYMYQSDDYGKEIADIDRRTKLNENDEEYLDPNSKDVINRRRKLVELQRESILAAEDEKQAIKDLVQEGIDKELDALQERIDLHNEELDSMKDLYDYQKNVEEQTKNIASLRKQLNAYEGFNNEETRAKVQELKVSLEEAEAELFETEYDKFISDQTALLDNLYTEYETILNTRLDNIDYLLEQVVFGINGEGAIATALGSDGAIAQEIIKAVGENGSIKTILNAEANNVGTTLSDTMNSIWTTQGTGTNSILATYGQGFQDKQTLTNSALDNIKLNVAAMVDDVDKDAQKKVEAPETQPSTKADPTKTNTPTTTPNTNNTNTSSGDGVAKVGDKVKFVSGKYYYDSEGKSPAGSKNLGKEVYITKINDKSWATHPIHISTGKTLGSGDLGWLKRSQISGYATGKKKISNSEYAWTQENGREFIVRPSDGAILTPIAKGDSVLNATASGNIWSMANNPTEFIKNNLGLDGANIPSGANVQNTYHQTIENVTFDLKNVKNYEELLYALKDDRRFEKLVTAMTIDRIAGKSGLAKGKSIR